MNVDPEEAKKRIAALLRERQGYVMTGKDERVKQVDEQLKYYGHKSPDQEVRRVPPQGRSERPSTQMGQK